jgi:glutamine synthetase
MNRRTPALGSTGRSNFVARFGLRDDESAAAAVVEEATRRGLEVVRLSFADQHGVLRGKTLALSELESAMANGCTMVTTLLTKDTAHITAYPAFTKGGGFGMAEMTGASDFVMVPDPATFRVLPWAEATGWLLCDIYFPNGKAVPFSTRDILRRAIADLAARGFDYVSGLEVEFHLFKLEDPKLRPEDAGQPPAPPEVSLLAHGFQYLTEQRMDELDPFLTILRRELAALGLPLRTIEVEYGPSQIEITMAPETGLASADTMILFRSAVKQISRRHGYHATFMCRPGLANMFASGWHLHQSLLDRKTGANVFMPATEAELLSPLGRNFVAGLAAHARAGSVFAAPTINGYKRVKTHSLAPDRVSWSRDNRGAMLRIIGGPGDVATRIENRAGEPAANPYLFMASQIVAGLDGIVRNLDPGPPTDTPYDTAATPLPVSLMEAIAALAEDNFFQDAFGEDFIAYITRIKQAEISRFLSSVTDWEHREYFEIF